MGTGSVTQPLALRDAREAKPLLKRTSPRASVEMSSEGVEVEKVEAGEAAEDVKVQTREAEDNEQHPDPKSPLNSALPSLFHRPLVALVESLLRCLAFFRRSRRVAPLPHLRIRVTLTTYPGGLRAVNAWVQSPAARAHTASQASSLRPLPHSSLPSTRLRGGATGQHPTPGWDSTLADGDCGWSALQLTLAEQLSYETSIKQLRELFCTLVPVFYGDNLWRYQAGAISGKTEVTADERADRFDVAVGIGRPADIVHSVADLACSKMQPKRHVDFADFVVLAQALGASIEIRWTSVDEGTSEIYYFPAETSAGTTQAVRLQQLRKGETLPLLVTKAGKRHPHVVLKHSGQEGAGHFRGLQHEVGARAQLYYQHPHNAAQLALVHAQPRFPAHRSLYLVPPAATPRPSPALSLLATAPSPAPSASAVSPPSPSFEGELTPDWVVRHREERRTLALAIGRKRSAAAEAAPSVELLSRLPLGSAEARKKAEPEGDSFAEAVGSKKARKGEAPSVLTPVPLRSSSTKQLKRTRTAVSTSASDSEEMDGKTSSAARVPKKLNLAQLDVDLRPSAPFGFMPLRLASPVSHGTTSASLSSTSKRRRHRVRTAPSTSEWSDDDSPVTADKAQGTAVDPDKKRADFNTFARRTSPHPPAPSSSTLPQPPAASAASAAATFIKTLAHSLREAYPSVSLKDIQKKAGLVWASMSAVERQFAGPPPSTSTSPNDEVRVLGGGRHRHERSRFKPLDEHEPQQTKGDRSTRYANWRSELVQEMEVIAQAESGKIKLFGECFAAEAGRQTVERIASAASIALTTNGQRPLDLSESTPLVRVLREPVSQALAGGLLRLATEGGGIDLEKEQEAGWLREVTRAEVELGVQGDGEEAGKEGQDDEDEDDTEAKSSWTAEAYLRALSMPASEWIEKLEEHQRQLGMVSR
ncbi:hypothetical protein JCM10213v2_008965 [Rhodosporidiobolus nylandii]